MLALYITHEAEKRGVTIEYAKMPVDSSSAFGETMLSVVRAFDRLHARLSPRRAAAGSSPTSSRGFRAGGRAPYGYRLKHEDTGGLRGGAGPEVDARRRPAGGRQGEGVPRSSRRRRPAAGGGEARRRSQKPTASLIGIERNALTYAGYTVWNMRKKVKPTREDPRKRMDWRPRTEWQISEKPTHEALITRAQAERILAAVDVANPKPRAARPGTREVHPVRASLHPRREAVARGRPRQRLPRRRQGGAGECATSRARSCGS
jgi:hypothetical protein